MPGSSAGWIGSSSSRRRFVFKKSVSTQRPQYIPTWHAKNYWILIMRGGGIRRRSLQSTRAESLERPLYFLWLSHRLTRITCQMRFLRRKTGGAVGESGGRGRQGGAPWDPGGGRGPVPHLTY